MPRAKKRPLSVPLNAESLAYLEKVRATMPVGPDGPPSDDEVLLVAIRRAARVVAAQRWIDRLMAVPPTVHVFQ